MGVIEVDKPGGDASFGTGEIDKEYPQTGDGDGSLVKTWDAAADDAAPLLVLEDGQLYLRKSTKEVDLSEETATEERAYDDLTEQAVPESITVTRDGVELEMQLASVDYAPTPGTLTAEGTLDHGYLIDAPSAPEAKDITFTDPDTGLTQTVQGQLVSTEQTEPFAWRAVEFPIRYYGDESYEIFQLDDTYIAYDTAAPQWQGLDALVLEHVELPAENYRLTGSEWTSGWVLDEDGRAVRHGVLYGEMYAARWVSTYAAETQVPLYSATAVYTAASGSGALIVADYAPISMATVLAVASVGVLLLALAVIVFLLLLRRKRKGEEDNGEHNPVYQG